MKILQVMRVIITIILLVGIISNTFAQSSTVVRKAGQDGVHTHRIPALCTTTKGSLIAAYDNRYENSRDLQGNIDIGVNRSTDNGKTWEPMRVRSTWVNMEVYPKNSTE